ncbi:hypothetical protein K9L16_02625 [Candidatus Pacearchaeota archaeon]|nr:hypothetical protein [Candidatus Pacearchaeota archaeon]
MKTQQKTKLFFIIIIFLALPLVSSATYIINISIQTSNLISQDYLVVGDLFYYNISIINNDSDTINDTFKIEIITPDNQSIAFGNVQYIFSNSEVTRKVLPLYERVNLTINKTILVPYINKSKNNDVKNWPFDIAGDYTLKICSSNRSSEFIHFYKEGRYHYGDHCINHYFSAMPEWQYQLFTEQKKAAEKTQEANDKMIDLTLNVNDATQTLKGATIAMLVVALITLYVSTREEKDKKKKLYCFVKLISEIGMVILIVWLIYLILKLFRVIIVV